MKTLPTRLAHLSRLARIVEHKMAGESDWDRFNLTPDERQAIVLRVARQADNRIEDLLYGELLRLED